MDTKRSKSVYLIVFACILVIAAGVCLHLSLTRQPFDVVTIEDKRAELAAAEGNCRDDSIILMDVPQSKVEELAEKLGASYRITKDGRFAALYLSGDTTIYDVYQDEAYEPYVLDMYPDYIAKVCDTDALGNTLVASSPNYTASDELYDLQSYLDYIDLADTWNTTKGQGVTVAIIDTGIDTDHPEFAGRISEYSYNASEDKVVMDYGMSVIEDEVGHGTKVAGVLAAGMDGQGIVGIAPEVELVIIKCEADAGGTFVRSSDLVFGLAYAIERDVDVVNMSFGTKGENIYSKYTSLAKASDVILVAAAGNDGSSIPVYPAADPYVIGIGAMDQESWSLASYSNYGDNSDLLAPGTTLTTSLDGEYGYSLGTSLSCPVVAGAVALYRACNYNAEFSEVLGMLQASSIDLGVPGEDWENGFGLLDIHALICEEKGIVTYEMLTDEVANIKQFFVRGRNIQSVPEPERENVVLDGWYYDTEATDELEYYTTVFTQDTTLYASWINEDEGSAYIYTVLDDGTAELSSYLGKRRYLTVPEVVEGRIVTSIGELAFANNSRLRSVALPETLTNIAQLAFYNCTNLKSIDIPEAVTNIGGYAFSGCSRLTQVYIRNNSKLASIGQEAFALTGISSFTIPAALTDLGDSVFFGSTAMTSITVADGNTCFKVQNKALYNRAGDALIYYPASLSGTYTVAQGTKTIAQHAFAYSSSQAVILPSGVEVLGKGAFSVSAIRSLTIPASVESIGDELCRFCIELSSVVLEEGSYSVIPVNCFENCWKLNYISIPRQIVSIDKCAFVSSGIKTLDFETGSGLEFISNFAFEYTPLRSVTFPASLQGLGSCVFEGCKDLASVVFEAGSECVSIGPTAFANCTSLKHIDFPDSLQKLDERAFYGSGLESVSIGANVSEIREGALSGCPDLTSVIISSANAEYASNDGIVFTKDMTELIVYPAGKQGSYTIPSTVKKVFGYAFAGAEKLTEISFSSGLEEIGKNAFYSCTQIRDVAMPQALVSIGESAFEGCKELRSVTLNEALETISPYAFKYCVSLSSPISIPRHVVSIGYGVFDGDRELRTITIASDSELSRIGNGAFAGCGITDFTVPKSVYTMGQEVFTDCRDLLTVTFEGESQLTNMAAWTFKGADNLRLISFEEGGHLQLIDARAFEGLSRLESVNLEYCTELKIIDNYAFSNCSALRDLSLPASLEEIGRYAFNGCRSLGEIRLPSSISFIGRYAFTGTEGLSVFFRASALPVGLQENWDYGLGGYYLGISEIKTSGAWRYALTDDDKASIVAYSGNETDIVLNTIDGYEIVSIGGGAFKDSSITSIVLPNTVTGIYAAAFKGTGALKSITIPSAVQIIDTEAFMGSGLEEITFASGSGLKVLGRYAFANTSSLQSITIPAGVEKIRDYAFFGSGISSISFASGSELAEIGSYAFSNSSLAAITMPQSLKKIDYHAFQEANSLKSADFGAAEGLMIYGNAFYRSGLTSVNIPAGVTYLGELCFAGCQSLTEINVSSENAAYSSIGGVLFNKAATKLITCPAGKTGSYEIAASVNTLAFAAFEGSRIDSISFALGSQLVTIGYRAFCDCDGLVSISIPDSVVSIDNYAFAYCDNLQTVTISGSSKLGGIYKSAFYNDAKLTEFVIPDSVLEIGDYAFYGCSAMTTIQLAENNELTLIADHAFEYSGLTSFVMPSMLEEVGNYSFHGAKLRTVSFNEVIQIIGDFAFADCGLADVTELVLPDSVEYLGTGALRGADSIETITIPFVGCFADDTDHIFTDLFGGNARNVKKVVVRGGSAIGPVAFCNQEASLESLEEVVLPESLVELGGQAFANTYNLKRIVIPDGVKRIELATFNYSGISEVVLPASLEVIGEWAFYGCENLESIVLPEGLKEIGSTAFYNCSSLTSITIPKTVETIAAGGISGCKNLQSIDVEEGNEYYVSVDGILYNKEKTEIVSVPGQISGVVHIPEGISRIEAQVFANCVNITGIEFPDSLEFIGGMAFMGCNSLKSVTLPETVTEIEAGIFHSCLGLETLVIESPLSDLNEICYWCNNLKTLVLPEGLENIGDLAGLFSLEELIIPDSVTVLESLRECRSLKHLYIGASVADIMDTYTFSGCGCLENIEVSADNKNFVVEDGILYSTDHKDLIVAERTLNGSITVHSGVEKIYSMAFENCKKITGVTVKRKVHLLLRIFSFILIF